MGKKSSGRKAAKKSAEQTARRQLARAQLKFHIAQEKQVQARARGKGEVERARLKAARWLAKAAQAVERCSEDVTAAEVRLREVMREGGLRPEARAGNGSTPERARDNSSNVAADGLDGLDSQRGRSSGEPDLLASDGSGELR